MKRIYLASPYSGTKAQEIERYRWACQMAAAIIKDGHCVFSPIAHSHGIAVHGGLSGDHGAWMRQNQEWMDWADELWVLTLDGWKESKGVAWEIERAESINKPVRYMR